MIGTILAATLAAFGQQRTCDAATVRASKRVSLSARSCRPIAPGQKKWLPDDWKQFERFAIACPIKAGRGAPVLYLVSVDDPALEKTLPSDAPAAKLPHAIVLMPDGAVVARLPYAYPFDPPASLDVTFADWIDGLPRSIELFLEDPAVGGNRKLPSLKWDEKFRSYVSMAPAAGSR
jgi:hypothetical protein